MNKTTLCLFINSVHLASSCSGVSDPYGGTDDVDVDVAVGSGADAAVPVTGGFEVLLRFVGTDLEVDECCSMSSSKRGAFDPACRASSVCPYESKSGGGRSTSWGE